MNKMNCNIESIKIAVKKLDVSTNRLPSSLEGDWNDEVRDSYRRYISQCKQSMGKIRHSKSNMEAECEKINAIETSELVASAKSVSRAIDEV